MKRSFLIPVGLAVAGLVPKTAAEATAQPVTRGATAGISLSGSLTRTLLALPSSIAAAPLGHSSHSSHASHASHASSAGGGIGGHASHVSHVSHASHTSSVNPPPAANATTGYTDAQSLQNGIKAQGVTYKGAKTHIASAVCAGEPRYGTRAASYSLEYHRFSCTLVDANYRVYRVEIEITKSNAQYFWWQVISIVRSV